MQDAGVTTMSASEAFSLVDGRQAPLAGQVGEDQDHWAQVYMRLSWMPQPNKVDCTKAHTFRLILSVKSEN